MFSKNYFLLLFFFSLFFHSFCWAHSPSQAEEPPSYVQIDSETRYQRIPSLGDSSLNLFRESFSANTGYPASEKLLFIFNAQFEYAHYGWKNYRALGSFATDAVQNTYVFRLSPGFIYSIRPKWKIVTSFSFSSSKAESGKFSDSFTYGGILILSHQFSEKLSLSGGIVATSRLDRSALFFPILGLEWKPTPKIELKISGRTTGPALIFSYKFLPRFNIFIESRFEDWDYRTRDSHLGNGLFSETNISIFSGIQWSPRKKYDFSLALGNPAYQKVKYKSQQVGRIFSEKSSGFAPLFILNGHFEF